MKYLKITSLLFLITLVLSFTNTQAQVISLNKIKIPAFKHNYMEKSFKMNDTYQYIKKIDCTDNLSGDGRAILAGLHLTTGNGNPDNDPEWVEIPKGQNVRFDSKSKQMGSWNLYLQSKKKLVTTATFTGEWTVD